MKRICVALLCASVLIVVLGTCVLAQYDLHERSRVGVRAVVFRPDASELTGLNANWLGPQVDFHLGFDDYDRPTQMISVGWFGEDSGRATGKLVPLTASYVYRFGDESANPWYIGGGIGAYFASYEYIQGFSIVKDKETKMGYHVSFGREVGSWFGGVEYHFIDELGLRTGESLDFSGWSIVLGARYTF